MSCDLPGEKEGHGAFSPDGRWLAVSTATGGCQLYEVGAWKAGQRFNGVAFCWSADGKLFVINDILGVIRFVEPATGREVYRVSGPETTWYAWWSVCVSPDGTKLTARATGTPGLYVWDLRLIRRQLNALGMDWEAPPFVEASDQPALTLEVDRGALP